MADKTATLIVSRSYTTCSACGNETLPGWERHDRVSGFGGGDPGCGALFTAITTDGNRLNDYERAVLTDMRPDLPIVEPGSARRAQVEDDDAELGRLQQTAEAEAGLRQALVDADGAVTAAEAERDVALAERDQARVIARILKRRDANLHLEYEIRLGLGPLPRWLTEGGDPA